MPDPDVIEFSAGPAHRVRNRLLIAGAVAAVAVIAAVAVLVGIRPGGGAAGGHANPALARLIAQVTGVPVGTSEAVGDGHGQVTRGPSAVTGSRLDANGKPGVLYVGTEYCPYCAAQRWT